MGPFASYTFEGGLLLLCAYLIYKWLLSGCNQPVFNRGVLIACYAASFVVPALVHLFPAAAAADAATGSPIIALGSPQAMLLAPAAPWWATLLLWCYLAGMACALAMSLAGAVRLWCVLRSAQRLDAGRYTLAVLADSRFAPFGWGRFVAMSRADLDSAGSLIVLHEQAHIRAWHWIDLLVAQLVCIVLWYNPASWLMRDELRAVHEYQADRSVLRSGADARQYQMLLIKKAVGQRFPSLANSLNHSKLKKRITMMCNQESSKRLRVRALAVVPAMALALAVVNIPAVASAISAVSHAPLAQTEGKDSKKDSAIKVVSVRTAKKDLKGQVAGFATPSGEEGMPDELPSYPGGESAMFKFLIDNIVYPPEAEDKNIEGRVVVQFVVEADGKVAFAKVGRPIHPLLDAEALRVVSLMPAWTPAKKDGKAVRCGFALPVTFKLKGDSKPAKQARPAVFIDGKRVDADLDTIPSDNVESITVRKDNPDYPDGAVYIILKK